MSKQVLNSIKFIVLVYVVFALFGFTAWYSFFYQDIKLFSVEFELIFGITISIILWCILNRKRIQSKEVRLNNLQEMMGNIKESKVHLILAIVVYVSALLIYDKSEIIMNIESMFYQWFATSNQNVSLLSVTLLDNIMMSRIFAVYIGIYILNIILGGKMNRKTIK